MRGLAMWRYLIVAGIVALIGCGGSGGSGSTGTTGGDNPGNITRAFDGSWHGTFQTVDHFDSGPVTFDIVNGHVTGVVNRKDPEGGPRIDEPIEATTYDNPIIVGDVNHIVFSSSVGNPGMQFFIRIQYPFNRTVYAQVVASQ